MSITRALAKLLLCVVLQLGVLSGARMSPEDIEKLMNVMHRTKVEWVVKKDEPV